MFRVLAPLLILSIVGCGVTQRGPSADDCRDMEDRCLEGFSCRSDITGQWSCMRTVEDAAVDAGTLRDVAVQIIPDAHIDADLGMTQDMNPVDEDSSGIQPPPPDGPDILARILEFQVGRVFNGQRLQGRVEVANIGLAPTPAFECAFFLRDLASEIERNMPSGLPQLTPIRFDGLAPGDSDGRGLAIPVPADLAPGHYRLFLLCDPDNEIAEVNNENNLISAEIQIYGPADRPDLVIERLSSTPSEGQIAGEDVLDVGLTVCNRGGSPSGAGDGVHLVVSANPNLNGVTRTLRTVRIPGLIEPDRCAPEINVRFQASRLPCREPLEFFLVGTVDPEGRIVERDERNNVTSSAGPLTLVCDPCEGDEFDPNDAAEPPRLEAGQTYEMYLCPNDTDRVSLPWTGGLPGSLVIETEQDTSLNVSVDGVTDGNSVGLVRSVTQPGRFADGFYATPSAEEYILTLTNRGPEYGHRIRITATTTPLGPADRPMGCTDPFERNNSGSSAVPLADAFESPELDFCPETDADVYRVELSQGETIRVGTELDENGAGTIQMVLYPPDAMGSILSVDDRAPEFEYQAEVNGRYLIVINHQGGHAVSYRFTAFEID